MTNNELFLARLSGHMAISADSGVSRLTRAHLKTAMLMAFGGLPRTSGAPRFESMVDAFIALVDRAREERLFAQQREHRAMLEACTPPVWRFAPGA